MRESDGSIYFPYKSPDWRITLHTLESMAVPATNPSSHLWHSRVDRTSAMGLILVVGSENPREGDGRSAVKKKGRGCTDRIL